MRWIVVMALAGYLGLTAGAAAQGPTDGCRQYIKAPDRRWQASAPRGPLRVGQPITIGLKESQNEDGTPRVVRVRIIGGATQLESKSVTMVDENFADIVFPRDFRATQALSPGAYTVLWLLGAGGTVIACDGFVIR